MSERSIVTIALTIIATCGVLASVWPLINTILTIALIAALAIGTGTYAWMFFASIRAAEQTPPPAPKPTEPQPEPTAVR